MSTGAIGIIIDGCWFFSPAVESGTVVGCWFFSLIFDLLICWRPSSKTDYDVTRSCHLSSLTDDRRCDIRRSFQSESESICRAFERSSPAGLCSRGLCTSGCCCYLATSMHGYVREPIEKMFRLRVQAMRCQENGVMNEIALMMMMMMMMMMM